MLTHARFSSARLTARNLAILLALVSVLLNPQAYGQEVFEADTPGTYTFNVPANVTSITVEVWGGGGGGGPASRFLSGAVRSGGGGGGAYATRTLEVASGDSFSYRVGAGGGSEESGGDSWFGGTSVLLAQGGSGVSGNTIQGGAGGEAAQSVGDQVYGGGPGSNAQGNAGGGGGGSAGTGSDGNPGSGLSGGVAVTGGGAGGDGSSGGGGADGRAPGGGGGGASCRFLVCTFAAGGDGGDGRVRITYTVAGPDICYSDEFASGTLDADNWVTSVSNGNFQPSIVNGRLRMTQAQSNQATAATVQRRIPGADNLVILEFDYYAYGGSGADGLAFVLSDANVTPQPGSYGGSLGYAQRNTGDSGFAGGWIGIGLDEFGNFSNNSEGRVGGPGVRQDAVAIRGAAPNYRYLEGTGTLSPGIDSPNTSNPAPQRYRIVVDSRGAGQAIISVERDLTATGNNYQTLIAPFNALTRQDQPPVPENFLLSMTGSTGGSNNIHEFDNFSLCALKLEEVGAQVDHFEIEHDGVGLTCQASENITIRACANSDCSQRFTDPVQATMSPSGWVGGDTVTVTGGEVTAALRRTVPGTVTLGVVGSVPATRPQSVTLCSSGTSGLAASNCQLSFYESGLVFDVPDMVANEPETEIAVRAVRTEGSPEQACVPAFSGVTRTVAFWSGYINPDDAGVSSSPQVVVNEEPVSGNSASPTSIPLEFDTEGVARIDVNYPDAGRMQLQALYSGSEATEDQGLVMPGADHFVSVPYGFCIEATEPEASCGAPLASCSVLTVAGDPFDLVVRAVASESGGNTNLCAGNLTTTNFRANLELAHNLEAPAGGVPGLLGENEAVFDQSAAGEVTLEQSVSEIGVFRFTAPAGQPYLGTSLPGAGSDAVGRFIPARFEVVGTAVDPGTLAPGCELDGSDIHYIGQPMQWAVPPLAPISALNRQGAVTTNYTRDDFQKLTPADVNRQSPVADEAQTVREGGGLLPLASEVHAGELLVDNDVSPGVMDFVFSSDDDFWYPKTRQARVGPFRPSLGFELTAITDSDGVQAPALPYEFTAGLAADPATGDPFEVVYGRLILENVYGPETLDELLMEARLEAWSDSGWVNQEAGSCTPDALSAVADADATTQDFHDLDTTGAVSGSSAAQFYLRLEPAAEGTDTLEWDLASGALTGEPPAVHDWLMEFWGRSPAPDELQSPQGLATFGVHRGHDRIIYWREVLD